MRINRYPDGTSYVTIPKEWEGTYQEITFKINSYEDLWHLSQLCDVLKWNHIEAHITIPCLLDGQADRRFGEFQSRGVGLIAEFLNEYDNVSFGIFHPHNPEVVENVFYRAEIIDNSEFIKSILYQYEEAWDSQDNLILMSSDAGGFKPLMKLCDKIKWGGETYSASKSRSYNNGETTITQLVDRQDFGGKDILIIDDISVYGGTFKGLSKLLKERNCGKLYLAVSHMTLENLGDDPVTNYFDKVFTTNSKFDHYYTPDKEGGVQPENLEIIKLF